MAVVTPALLETQRAFDGVAASYDRSNADNPLLCAMRERTRAALERAVPVGSHLLDLGCGPGTDELYFAARGYRVTAIDWSPSMVEEARQQVKRAGLANRVRVEQMGIDELDGGESSVRGLTPSLAPSLAPSLTPGPTPSLPRGPTPVLDDLGRAGGDRKDPLGELVFDAAYSSFGPLNCVADLPSAARGIARRLRPGGILVASVIGRVCPWEIALYAARAGWARAFVRFGRGPSAVPLQGRTVWTRYYSPREFERACVTAGFTRLSTRALGLFVPPPYMEAFASRHRGWVDRLQRLEDAAGSWPVLRSCGDHFLMVLRRT